MPRTAGSLVIFEATIVAGSQGDVIKGTEITKQQAIGRRTLGGDVVVCGPDDMANRRGAAEIERAAIGAGNYRRHSPHASAGKNALPHYQPIVRPPAGHTFYETKRLKAKTRK